MRHKVHEQDDARQNGGPVDQASQKMGPQQIGKNINVEVAHQDQGRARRTCSREERRVRQAVGQVVTMRPMHEHETLVDSGALCNVHSACSSIVDNRSQEMDFRIPYHNAEGNRARPRPKTSSKMAPKTKLVISVKVRVTPGEKATAQSGAILPTVSTNAPHADSSTNFFPTLKLIALSVLAAHACSAKAFAISSCSSS